MRIRTIKPEFWSSPDMADLPFFDRLLFIGLWSIADDWGRLQADPRYIRGELFSLDTPVGRDGVQEPNPDPAKLPAGSAQYSAGSASISDGLERLRRGGQITIYRVGDSRRYCQVVNFVEYQKIDKRSKERIPSPTRDDVVLLDAWGCPLDSDPAQYSAGSAQYSAGSASISDGLERLRRGGQITIYRVGDSRRYCQVVNFVEYQKIDKRSKERIPSPTRDDVVLLDAWGCPLDSDPAQYSAGSAQYSAGSASFRALEREREREKEPTSSLRSSVGGPGGGADSEHPLVPPQVDDAAAVAPAAPPARRDDTKPAKGSRLPDSWTPSRTEANLRAEDKTGGGPSWLTDQLERFRDYWTAQAGTKGVKRDWDATWRNWIRRSATDFQPPQQQMKSRHQQETDAWYARTQARIEANDGKNPLLELIEGT